MIADKPKGREVKNPLSRPSSIKKREEGNQPQASVPGKKKKLSSFQQAIYYYHRDLAGVKRRGKKKNLGEVRGKGTLLEFFFPQRRGGGRRPF